MHNSKEIVNLQDMFVLTVGYIDMTKYLLTKYCYVIERVSVIFIGCLYYLLVHFQTCCFYIQYHRGTREINAMPDRYFALCYVLYY